ncbi:Copia protein [Trichinella spiralis]|uniref:Copia protein n=1 Tax=Trichinella spiralis TaxID=6334 RepID=A0ABR3KF99_TRISP
MTSTPFPKVANRAKKQIELIPSDICGPMITATPSDHRYMMTFIDDYYRFTVVHLLKTKDEAVDRIKDYVATLHTKFGQRYWGEPVCTAAFLQNRLPSRSISKTPFELWTGNKPNVDHIRIFGYNAYCYIPKQKRRKWVNKAREGVIVGYGGITKGYRLLSPTTNEIWISRSGKIIEDYSHMKNESAVPKGAIERSREYDDIPKLLKKEDNVIIEDIFGPTQEELSGEPNRGFRNVPQGLRVSHEPFIRQGYCGSSVHEHVAPHSLHGAFHIRGLDLRGPYDDDR